MLFPKSIKLKNYINIDYVTVKYENAIIKCLIPVSISLKYLGSIALKFNDFVTVKCGIFLKPLFSIG